MPESLSVTIQEKTFLNRELVGEFDCSDVRRLLPKIHQWTIAKNLQRMAAWGVLKIVRKGRPGRGNIYRSLTNDEWDEILP